MQLYAVLVCPTIGGRRDRHLPLPFTCSGSNREEPEEEKGKDYILWKKKKSMLHKFYYVGWIRPFSIAPQYLYIFFVFTERITSSWRTRPVCPSSRALHITNIGPSSKHAYLGSEEPHYFNRVAHIAICLCWSTLLNWDLKAEAMREGKKHTPYSLKINWMGWVTNFYGQKFLLKNF